MSTAFDLEKGVVGGGSNPATAAAAEDGDRERQVAMDPRRACLGNIGIFCVATIAIFVGVAHSLLTAGGPSWEAFVCTVVAFLPCAGAVGTVLYVRKDLVGACAEVRPEATS